MEGLELGGLSDIFQSKSCCGSVTAPCAACWGAGARGELHQEESFVSSGMSQSDSTAWSQLGGALALPSLSS